MKVPLLVWLNWLEHHPVTEGLWLDSWSGHVPGLWVQYPVRAYDPQSECMIPSPSAYGRQPVNVSVSHPCFSPFLSPSPSKSNAKMSLGEDKKIIKVL